MSRMRLLLTLAAAVTGLLGLDAATPASACADGDCALTLGCECRTVGTIMCADGDCEKADKCHYRTLAD